MIRVMLLHRLRVRPPAMHNRPVQLPPHVQAVGHMPAVGRPDPAGGIAAQGIGVIRQPLRPLLVGVEAPRVLRQEFFHELRVNAPWGQPRRGDHVEVAAACDSLRWGISAWQRAEVYRVRELTMGKVLSVLGQDLGDQIRPEERPCGLDAKSKGDGRQYSEKKPIWP